MRVLGSLLLASTLLLFSVSAAQDANPQPRMLRYANHEIRQATRATVLENKLRRDEDEDARMSRRQESRLYPRQSSCMCPPGAQGPPGPQGPDGIPGPQGQQGLQLDHQVTRANSDEKEIERRDILQKRGIDPYIGEMILVAFGFCPQGYAEAKGQTLTITSNVALFSLLGTNYGGDGRSTFNLPDMRPCTPNPEGGCVMRYCIATIGIYPVRP